MEPTYNHGKTEQLPDEERQLIAHGIEIADELLDVRSDVSAEEKGRIHEEIRSVLEQDYERHITDIHTLRIEVRRILKEHLRAA